MFAVTPTSSKAPLSPETPAKHKPILAERFKTKMCRTWTEKGECPYEFRCMFAHGEEDLRTKAMNIADGLTTDEAIRTFQYASAPSATPTSPAADLAEIPAAVSSKPAPLEPSKLLRFVEALTSPAKDHLPTPAVSPAASPQECAIEAVPSLVSDCTSERSTTPASPMRRYRHDPYAPVVMGPPSLSCASYPTCALSPVASAMDLDLAEAAPCAAARSTPPATTYGAFSSLLPPARSYAVAAGAPAEGSAPAPRVLSTYGPKTTYCAS